MSDKIKKASTADLVASVAADLSIKKKDAELIVKSVIAGITSIVKEKSAIQITDFGIVRSKERPARKGYNPRTGESIDIAASTSVTFKAAPAFKKIFQ